MTLSRNVVLVDDEARFLQVVAGSKKAVAANIEVNEILLKDMGELGSWLHDVQSQLVATPSLIVLDMEIDDEPQAGLEALKKVRELPMLQHIPVVIFSLHDGRINVLSSYENGVFSYIKKPRFEKEQIKRLTEIFEYWLYRNIAVT